MEKHADSFNKMKEIWLKFDYSNCLFKSIKLWKSLSSVRGVICFHIIVIV